MKVPKQKNNKKLLLMVLVPLLLLLVGGATVYAVFKNTPTETQPATQQQSDGPKIDTSDATQEQIDAGTVIKGDSINSDNEAQPETLTVSLNAFKKTEQVVHVVIDVQSVIETGSCTLVATKDGVNKSYTADIQAQSSYSTCKGFDINTSDLSTGTWSFKVTVSSNGRSGVAAADIEI